MTKAFTTITLALLCLCYSCTEPTPNAALKRKADSLDLMAKANKMAQQIVQRQKDSTVNARHAKDSLTTIQVKHYYGPSPVAIKHCSVSAEAHGEKAIFVTLKNTGRKKIDMVHLAWTVYNKQGNAIGNSNGKAKKDFPGGRTSSYAWPINAPSGTHGKASVIGLHFKDGSVWMASN